MAAIYESNAVSKVLNLWELVTKILCSVPVTEVGRMLVEARLVCKTWKEIVDKIPHVQQLIDLAYEHPTQQVHTLRHNALLLRPQFKYDIYKVIFTAPAEIRSGIVCDENSAALEKEREQKFVAEHPLASSRAAATGYVVIADGVAIADILSDHTLAFLCVDGPVVSNEYLTQWYKKNGEYCDMPAELTKVFTEPQSEAFTVWTSACHNCVQIHYGADTAPRTIMCKNGHTFPDEHHQTDGCYLGTIIREVNGDVNFALHPLVQAPWISPITYLKNKDYELYDERLSYWWNEHFSTYSVMVCIPHKEVWIERGVYETEPIGYGECLKHCAGMIYRNNGRTHTTVNLRLAGRKFGFDFRKLAQCEVRNGDEMPAWLLEFFESEAASETGQI